MLRAVSGLRSCPRAYVSRFYTSTGAVFAQKILTATARDPPIVQLLQRKAAEWSRLQSELAGDGTGIQDGDSIRRGRKLKELEPLHQAFDEWTRTKQSLEDVTPMLADPDPIMRGMAEDEHTALNDTLSEMVESRIPALFVGPSETAQLSAIMELRAGVGGSESALFVADLVRMYTGIAQSCNWSVTMLGANILDAGGMKDAILEIKGPQVYDALRWESGVHRVQRVPATETNGRVHTSTVTVLVLPLTEGGDPESTSDDLFTMDEIKIEVMRSRGAGGQHVNKTESAVRLTHVPTGITVSMQDERSQHQNRRRAFQVLRARLMDRKLNQEMIDRREVRRSLVRSADRSEKIRTYNYAQDRVTDHRLGMSVKNLDSVMEGVGLQDFLKALEERHREERLAEILEQP